MKHRGGYEMKYYTLEMLEDMYRQESPELPEEEIKKKAKELHRLLNTLDVAWKRSNRKFYSKVQLFGEE